ncbi:thymidine kinase [Nonomuraea sp. NPDC050328]|uniref:thymidine kinase n=1 Tax=Nonomuraea sp. NPDC050328 TaxID=3364361 RepID=UPI0037BD1FF5
MQVVERVAQLRFFYGPMDCGKSTLALQMNYNHGRQGRRGLVLTKHDRSGGPQVTTRIGLDQEAIEVTDGLDLVQLVERHAKVDYLICDEACFYSVEQIEQLADLVDTHGVDVYAFGLASDFRSVMFPAAQRLFELADEVSRLQVEVLCWCGRAGQLNARVVDGRMVRTGEQVVIGDTVPDSGAGEPAPDPLPDLEIGEAAVRYQVLCRRHHREGDLGPNAQQL